MASAAASAQRGPLGRKKPKLTASASKYRCEVCVEFQGRTQCRTAAAATEMQARRTAQENACALISSGVTDSMQCGNSQPVSVKWLSAK